MTSLSRSTQRASSLALPTGAGRGAPMWAKGKSVSMRSCNRRSDAVPSVMLEKGLRFARVLGIILALSLSGNSHTALSLAQTGQIGGDHKETTPGVITTAQIKEELPVLITTAAPVTTVTPHEPPEVRSFAERQYLIASFVWSDAQARGATVGKVLVPADLAGFPVLSQKLSYFRHIRMDVDIEIRILSSAYNYGALGYAWNFGFPFPTGHADCRDWRQLWQHRSGYIPVQDREGIKFTMPWSSNRSYVQNDSWGTENGAIILFVASPLKSIDANPSDVQVQVFATMRNVIEQGPDPTTVVAVQSSRQRRKKWKKPVWEDRQRRFNEMLPDHVNDQIAAWIATGKDGDPDPSTAKPIKKEAEEKTKSGIISGFVRKVGSVATLATPIPIVGELAAGIAAGAGALAPILESFGLTKPSTLMAPTPMYDVSNLELVQGTGLSRVNRLGLMPDDFLEDPANAVPSEDWDPSVHDFVRRPGYVLAFTWTAAVATSASLQKMWVDPFLSADDAFTTNPYVVYPTPLAHMAQYYAACRGSIKYHVVFVGHQFIKGKVRISFSPSGTFYAPLEDVGGDMLSRTVDVVGTTSVDFTVPYFGVLPWFLCQELSGGKVRIPYGMQSGAFGCMTGGWGALNFSVVNPLIVTDTVVNPTVDVLVFQAAGEDFQFSRLVGRNTLLTTHQLGNAPAVRAEIKGVTKQCSIESRFKASFPGLAPGMNFNVDEGYVNHKQDMTFRTQLHRYSVTGATVGDGAIPTEPFWRNGLGGTYGEPSDASLHSEFSRLFLYWRGSMRFGYADAVSPPTGPAEYSVAPASAGGGIVFPTNRYSTGTLYVPGPDRDNEVIYLEVPWYDVVPFRAVYDDWLGPDQVQCLYSLSTDQQFIWRAIGDDFGLSCPTACPVLTFAPAALPERAGKATSSHDVTRPSRSGTPAPSF